ncbi:MAG: aldehyde dehydrogenase family protein [Granulosicoccus sp.]
MSDRRELFTTLMGTLGLGSKPQSLVGGQLRDGNGSDIDLEDPYSRQILSTYADCGAELASIACDTAAAAQAVWLKDFTAAHRGNVMQSCAAAIDRSAETLATLEALVAGKPIRDCRLEVSKVAEMFRYYAGWSDKLHGEVIPVPSGHLNYTLREPIGVIFQITPWNAPVFTAGWQIAPAIATGNAVVIKPSELTPVTSVALVRVAEAAGLPEGLVNVLAGLGPTAGEAAITHEAIRKVVFVGSPETGRAVATAAGRQLKPVVLELGGKSANIVFPDADLDAACRGAQAAIFSAAGQSCVAGSRLLVHRDIEKQFLLMLESGMSKLTMGDPLDENTEIGPISNVRQFRHVNDMLQQAVETEGGHKIAAKAPTSKGLFVAPTILTGLHAGATAATREIFGPVVTSLAFSDEADAIRIANQTDFGLAGAVWTADGGRAHRIANAVRAGTFWINSYKAIHVSSPFGGSRSSGFGRSSGTDALMEYTNPKSVWVDTSSSPLITFGYAPDKRSDQEHK